MHIVMVLIGLIILFALLKLTLKIYSEIKVSKILKSDVIGSPETSCALMLVFGSGNVLSNLGLRHFKSSNRMKYKFDNIVIQKNGIFLVTTCPLKGKIICEDPYTWFQIYKEDGINSSENAFSSPLAETQARISVLYEIADEVQMNRKYIKGLVCMSSPNAVMSSYTENVANLEDTIQAILFRRVKRNIPLIKRWRFKKLLKERARKSNEKQELYVTRR